MLAAVGWVLAGEAPRGTQEISDRSSWLTALADETPLVELSIPGTHDTMTFGGGAVWWLTRPYSRTQTLELAEQLRAGVRYLDIRVRNDGTLSHAWVGVSGTLDDVFAAAETFLTEQPGEFLLVRLRDEQRTDHRAFRQTVAPILSASADRLWRPSDHRAMLGEARGSIVVLRDTLGSLGPHLDAVSVPFWDEAFRIQDTFHAPPAAEKLDAVRDLLAEDAALGLRFNHVSATAPWCPPRCYAAQLNPRVERALRDAPAAPASGTGVVILDFPRDSLLAAIIASNR